mgnify:CR=1 FL=1
MRELIATQKGRVITLALVIAGVVSAIFGTVRSGSVLLALGTAGYAYLRYREAEKKRRIELFLPLLLAALLFVVALTLPHAR